MTEEERGIPKSPDARPRRRLAASVEAATLQHPLDQKATAALRNAAGFDDLVRLLSEYGVERVQRIVNLASAIQVSERQFPDIYELYLRCTERIGVRPAPPLYIASGAINAYTGGIDHPYIVLTSGLINVTTPAELEYVIGHELGHIRCEHLLYQTMSRTLPNLSQLVPMVGRLLSASLSLLLMEWYRNAELSCDRFGLLCCQDLDAAIKVNIKLAGAPFTRYDQINPEAYLAQYEDFSSLDGDKLSFLYKLLAQAQMTHPWLVLRAHELKNWHDHGDYAAILHALPWEPEAPATGKPWALPPRFCARCHQQVADNDAFCSACGDQQTRVGHTCPACQTACPPADRFCHACGTPVGGPA